MADGAVAGPRGPPPQDDGPPDDRPPDRGPPSDGTRADPPGEVSDASTEGPRIRPLRDQDLAQVTRIERASFATPWSEETFANLLKRPNACLLSAVDPDERVLGYAAVWFTGGEGELGDLAVEPVARRAGIGTLLLHAVLSEGRARGARQIFLEVREGNRTAQSLYLRHGFEVVGRRPGYYESPVEDALVMRCLLLR